LLLGFNELGVKYELSLLKLLLNKCNLLGVDSWLRHLLLGLLLELLSYRLVGHCALSWGWHFTSHFGIVCINKVLKHEVIGILSHEFLCRLRVHLTNGIKHVLSHVFISVLLEYFTRERLLFVLGCVDEVAEVISLATLRPVVIFAGNSPVIANLNQLIFNFLLFLNLFNVLIFEYLN
jgi:hypothetical protein